jgi:hypothetical protein
MTNKVKGRALLFMSGVDPDTVLEKVAPSHNLEQAKRMRCVRTQEEICGKPSSSQSL